MVIFVVGAGKVGMNIAGYLVQEEHNVIIIDKNEKVIKYAQDNLDAQSIIGNGSDARFLTEVGANKADILIATMASDETNILCCLIAKRLGTKHVIARVRDPEYDRSLSLMKDKLGIDMTVNPEHATALEISRLLRYPFAGNIESVARGKAEVVRFVATEKDPIVNVPLSSLMKNKKYKVIFAVIERGEECFIPTGTTTILPGDHVFVVSDVQEITSFFRFLGKRTDRLNHVMIIGGGRVSYYLAKAISDIGIKVTVIEIKREKAEQLSDLLPGVTVVCGDGTDKTVLEEEGIDKMDAFVTLTDRDEENMMTGLYATKKGIGKVIVKNNRVQYTDIIRSMGLDSVVSPKQITVASILKYVRGNINGIGTKVEYLYHIMGGKAEVLEFTAKDDPDYTHVFIKDLKIAPGAILAVIVRNNKVIIPSGSDHIENKDTVIVISIKSGIRDLKEVIHK